MNRLANRFSTSVLAIVVSTSLAACGGGGSHSSTALPQTAPTSASAPAYTGPLADATFKISIPGPQSSAFKRRPSYVSSATKSLRFVINSSSSVSGTATTGTLGSYNLLAWRFFDTGTLPNANCPVDGSHAGNFICTVTLKLPPGTDNVTIAACDGTGGTCISPGTVVGNVLSEQIQSLTVVTATANSFNVLLDANVGTMTVNGSGSCQNGPVGASFGSVGTTPVTFTVAHKDAAGKTIVSPGLPKLQIQDGSAVWQSASGSIGSGSAGVTFTVTQSSQTFTITPNSTSSNQTINVRAIQPDTNTTTDGLSFTKSKSFTFATGVAPPSNNFLATVEQSVGTNSGQVDFFNVTLGGSGAADSITAFGAAPTLAQTNSTNENKPDVDNPLSLGWDSTGDLLIGNGNDGGPDHGNMACVPVGAIATGLAAATTVSSHVTSPVALAYDSRDGSVALANNPVAAPVQMPEFLLTGNYTAAPGTGAGTRNLVASGLGNSFVVNVPSLSAGTYASALTDGCEVDSAHTSGGGCPATGVSKIAIYSPTGVETDITDTSTFTIDNPVGFTIDTSNNQYVVGNFTVWHESIAYYSASSNTLVHTTGLAGPPVRRPFILAASPDGHIAAAWVKSPGAAEQVQVYDNSGARNPVGGPINYKVDSDAGCTTPIYGSDGAAIHALTWLSNTKLLVALEATSGGVFQSTNGIYVYDISSLVAPTSQYDKSSPGCPQMTATAPKQTGFVQLSKRPLGSAFKP